MTLTINKSLAVSVSPTTLLIHRIDRRAPLCDKRVNTHLHRTLAHVVPARTTDRWPSHANKFGRDQQLATLFTFETLEFRKVNILTDLLDVFVDACWICSRGGLVYLC